VPANAVVAICPRGYDAKAVASAVSVPTMVAFGAKDPGGSLDDCLAMMDTFSSRRAASYMIR
jgi:hypothetical protein